MDEQVYNRYYDTGGNYHWIGVHSGEHVVWKREMMTRDEAIKDIRENIKPVIGGKSLDMAIEALERKCGEWKVVDASEPRRYGCSNCKILSWDTYNFCPNCGADMRGDEDGV